jgi:hypothetical protein
VLCSVLRLTSMDSEKANFIREVRYLAEHVRQNCEHALWRTEQLLSRLQEGESLDTSATAAQLDRTREELLRARGGIERIEKLGELESRG